MGVFRVRAAAPDGKIVFKEVEAATVEEAGRSLEKDGLCPLDVSAGNPGLPWPFRFKGAKGVRQNDFLVFNHGFATLLKAGVPLLEGLDTLMRSPRDEVLNEAVKDVIGGVRNGQAISEAMARHPEAFPSLYVAAIGAGERTGNLAPSIKGYIEYQKKAEAVRKKVVSSAMYPVVLAIASVAVVGFLMVYVVPTFARIYTDSGAELPLPTRVLTGLTGFIRGYFFFIAFFLGIFLAALRFLAGGKAMRLHADRLKLRLPKIGEIYRGYAAAKFARTLGMVLRSGVPLVQALRMSRDVLDNVELESQLDMVIKKATEGTSVTDALSMTGLMPEITLRMFGVGEKTASLPEMLSEIADFHDEEVTHRVGVMIDLIEPALMVIMGLVIGAIVVSMYLPIFQLGARV